MSLRRFYVPRGYIRGKIARLPPDQAHHLRDVLRLKPGDPVELFDGEGFVYSGRVEESREGPLIVALEQVTPVAEPEFTIILMQALLKFSKLEWVLQKATELGVTEVVPVVTRYCDVRLPESRVGERLERWARIVREAAKQSRRTTVPKIHGPVAFGVFLNSCASANWTRLFFYEKAPQRWDKAIEIRGGAALCIGPEGGWHPDEVEAAHSSGFQMFNLGPRILRAETAALAGIVLVQNQILTRQSGIAGG